jgi:hypothetical protein
MESKLLQVDIHYQSSFERWYDRAAVRSKPRRMLSEELTSGLLCFSPELALVSRHPLLAACDASVVKEILIHHLFAYLTFTDRLEHEVVNRTARRIATGTMGLGLPPELRLDAYKIYCDEAYHSLFSVDLRHQIHTASGIDCELNTVNLALKSLRRHRDNLAPDLRKLAELFFVIVSETLISGILAKIPPDARIVTSVRQMISDHAEDERRHQAFFSRLCEIIWPQLTDREQRAIGPLLPIFILSFLSPDYPSIRAYLAKYLTREEVEMVIADSYPPQQLVSSARIAARSTLRLFQRCGILEDPETAESFNQSGLFS